MAAQLESLIGKPERFATSSRRYGQFRNSGGTIITCAN